MMRTLSIPAIVIALALALFAFCSNVKASDDGRNDMMCMAIFKTAFEQYGAEQIALEERETVSTADFNRALELEGHLKHFSNRVALFRWKANLEDRYGKTVFDNFTERYMRDLDTATALLHYDRCEHRVFEVFAEYKAARN